jgi:hypothetical protein
VSTPTIGVVILAARGGAALEAALAAATWADGSAVLVADGARRPSVPPGVLELAGLSSEVERLGTAWTLVLREDERLGDAAIATIRAAVAAARPDDVFALPVVASCLGLGIRRRPQARLALRGSRLALGRGLAVELAADGRPVRALDASVERAGAPTLDEAVERLGADASLVASLLDRDGRAMKGIVWQPLVAAAATLAARAPAGPLGLGRWVLAVLDGYAVVFAYARLWELRHDRAVSFT